MVQRSVIYQLQNVVKRPCVYSPEHGIAAAIRIILWQVLLKEGNGSQIQQQTEEW